MRKVTIEITEDEYQFLTRLAVLMKTQGNRMTSFPLYCIYDKLEDESSKFINCFLTEDAMNKHLDEYKDEFKNPYTYIRSMAYNDEIRQLMKIIVSLDDLVIPEHDNGAYE